MILPKEFYDHFLPVVSIIASILLVLSHYCTIRLKKEVEELTLKISDAREAVNNLYSENKIKDSILSKYYAMLEDSHVE